MPITSNTIPSLIITFFICISGTFTQAQSTDYFKVTSSSESTADSMPRNFLYFISITKKGEKIYSFDMLNLADGYTIHWYQNKREIRLIYRSNNTTDTSHWKNNNKNYSSSLEHLDYFSLLPWSKFYRSQLKFLRYHRKDNYQIGTSRSKMGLKYVKKNLTTNNPDSIVWQIGDDFEKIQTFTITPITFDEYHSQKISDILNAEKENETESVNADSLSRDLLFNLLGDHKFLLTEFWYLECLPCRKVLDTLNRLDHNNLEIYAFNSIPSLHAKRMINNYIAVEFKNIKFIDAPIGMIKSLHIHSFPTTILFDRNLNIVKAWTGLHSEMNKEIIQIISN